MIEQALGDHLRGQEGLAALLTTYMDSPAVFCQAAPPDTDELWQDGPQYPRIVYTVDLQGDPERIFGGLLTVDVMCKGSIYPEDLEPVLRPLIHGWFFSSGTFTVAAQWRESNYFEQPTDDVKGCTITFDLLGFPVLTTSGVDIIDRLNNWSTAFDGLHIINHDALPSPAWKPSPGESAIYWRRMSRVPAGWIPNTFSTIWRTVSVRGHVFSAGLDEVADISDRIITRLYAEKRLFKQGEAPIMVNRRNTVEYGADALRTGQITIDATWGEMVYRVNDKMFQHLTVNEKG